MATRFQRDDTSVHHNRFLFHLSNRKKEARTFCIVMISKLPLTSITFVTSSSLSRWTWRALETHVDRTPLFWMENGKLSQVGPKKTNRSRKPQQAHGNRNAASTPSRWLPCIHRPRNNRFSQSFQGFYRTDKGSTPTFHTHTHKYSWQTHTSRDQKPNEPSKPSNRIRELALMDSFPKPRVSLQSHNTLPHLILYLQASQIPDDSRHTIVTQLQKHPAQQTQAYSCPSV